MDMVKSSMTSKFKPDSPNQSNWIPKSEIHRDKFEKLSKYCLENPQKIKQITGVRLCCNSEFMIGKGYDGTRVYIGLSDDGYERAVKRIPKDAYGNLGLHEKSILNTINAVDSKYVVTYWSYYDAPDDEFVYLILDLCEETLEEYVQNQSLDDLTKDTPVIMRQILSGLCDLHRRPKTILHRDLKPSNIMRNVQGNWLVTDFGISRTMSDDQTTHRSGQRGTSLWRAVESYPSLQNRKDKSDNKSTKSDNEITKSDNKSTKSDNESTWSDNEITKSDSESTKPDNEIAKSNNESTKPDNESRYKRQSDIQTIGMVCFYILTKGKHPFGSEPDRLRNLLDGNPVGLVELTDPVAKDLISWMLQHNPKDRPYADESLKHPYLQPPDQQLELLTCVGNQIEIKRGDVSCDVVNQINKDSLLPENGWKSQIMSNDLISLGINRGYRDTWTDCLRMIRNCTVHPPLHQTSPNLADEAENIFLKSFSTLPVVVHKIIRNDQDWKKRPGLVNLFSKPDQDKRTKMNTNKSTDKVVDIGENEFHKTQLRENTGNANIGVQEPEVTITPAPQDTKGEQPRKGRIAEKGEYATVTSSSTNKNAGNEQTETEATTISEDEPDSSNNDQWDSITNSKFHREKFKNLRKCCREKPNKITKITGARVCCSPEFKIGKGFDGTRVYIGLSDDGFERAVKRLPKDECENLGLNEKNILNTLNAVDSKYVVRYRFYDDQSNEEYAYLMLDLCEETLVQYVGEKSLDDLTKDTPVIMRQILQGLQDLHRGPKPILHRDLKPSNILRNVHDKWLLADFGLSRTLLNEETTHRSDAIRGTTLWIAVESYPPENKKDKSDNESDMADNDSSKSDYESEMSEDSTKSENESTMSENESTKSDDESMMFVSTTYENDSTKPDNDSTKPDNDSTNYDNDSTKTDNDSMKPDNDSTKPDNDSTKYDNDSTKPDNDNIKHDNDSTKPDNNSRYKRQSDIQVAGMVCFYILTKSGHPFGSQADYLRNLLDGNPVGLVSLTDPVAKDFISWMLQHNPKDRPYAHEALKHPYLQTPDQQFKLLECVGNKREIKEGVPTCNVVTEINTDSLLSHIVWKSQIPPDALAYLCSDGKRPLPYGDEWTECLRLIRNKSQHWDDGPRPRPKVHYDIGEPQDYFLKLFPTLPVVVHRVIRSKKDWKNKKGLQQYFNVKNILAPGVNDTANVY